MKVPIGGTHNPPCPGPGAHRTCHGHPSCAAHIKEPQITLPGRKVRHKGEPCTLEPIKGGTVCWHHGGRASQVAAKAEANLTEAAARKEMAKLGLPDPVRISHTEALIWSVSAKYAEVLWLRSMVQSVEPADLVWGRTRKKKGGDDHGTTSEARANVWWVMLRSAEDQLVKFAVAAHAAGVADAEVNIAKQRGQMLGRFLDELMDALRDALIAAGVTTGDFPGVWAATISSLFPAAFRALGQSSGGEL